MKIRLATLEDLEAITDIYNWAIQNTVATFDTIPKNLQEQKIWFDKHDAKHPIIIVEVDHEVVGWASLSSWSDRCAYDQTAEVSFYVREDFHGKGIGGALLIRLDQLAQELHYHTLLSRIAGESAVSRHLHQKCGFADIGVMKEVGLKFGKLLDVYMMQKIYPLSKKTSQTELQT